MHAPKTALKAQIPKVALFGRAAAVTSGLLLVEERT
jgi:hypothetical protein